MERINDETGQISIDLLQINDEERQINDETRQINIDMEQINDDMEQINGDLCKTLLNGWSDRKSEEYANDDQRTNGTA